MGSDLWSQIFFRTKILLDPKLFWKQKFFDPKFFLTKKILTKKFLDSEFHPPPHFFWIKKVFSWTLVLFLTKCFWIFLWNGSSKKTFGPEKFLFQKFLSKKVWLKITFCKKILSPKNLCLKQYGRIFSIIKNFGQKNFLVKKIFWLKNFLSLGNLSPDLNLIS